MTPAADKNDLEIKIGYWNINTLERQGERKGERKSKILRIMEERAIDIMVLGETHESGRGETTWKEENTNKTNTVFFIGNKNKGKVQQNGATTGAKAKGGVMVVLREDFTKSCGKITVYFPLSKKKVKKTPNEPNQDYEYDILYEYWKLQCDRENKSEEKKILMSDSFRSAVDLDFATEDEYLDMLVLSFERKKGSFNLICCYAPVLDIEPNTTKSTKSDAVWRFYMGFLEKMMANLPEFPRKLMAICGDLNVNFHYKHPGQENMMSYGERNVASEVTFWGNGLQLDAKVRCEPFFDDNREKKNEDHEKNEGTDHEVRRELFTKICSDHNLEIATKHFFTFGNIYHNSSLDRRLRQSRMSTYSRGPQHSSNLDHFVVGYYDTKNKKEELIHNTSRICQLVEITDEKMTSTNFHRLCIATLKFSQNATSSSTQPNSSDPPPGVASGNKEAGNTQQASSSTPDTTAASTPGDSGVAELETSVSQMKIDQEN